MKNKIKAGLIIFSLALTAAVYADNETISRVAFGSCVHQYKAQPIWQAVNTDRPDVFIFLGDNIYGDTRDMAELQQKYDHFATKPGFRKLRKQSRVIATWDDHDFGENDAGADYPEKNASRKIMLDFWNEPPESERRSRDSGIYTSYVYGPPGKRVQIVLLDLRWNRTSLNSVSRQAYRQERQPRDMGPYLPVDKPGAVFLGEAQWQWLEQQLQQPADLRILASSLQLLPEFTGWESWANFPRERQRLFDLIRRHKVNGLFIVSGDTHWAEFSRVDNVVQYPLWELTSSGLTEEWKAISPNRHRLGRATHRNNYGLIEISWDDPVPHLSASIKNEQGEILLQNTVRLTDLR